MLPFHIQDIVESREFQTLTNPEKSCQSGGVGYVEVIFNRIHWKPTSGKPLSPPLGRLLRWIPHQIWWHNRLFAYENHV